LFVRLHGTLSWTSIASRSIGRLHSHSFLGRTGLTKQSTIASVIGAGLMLATTAFADPYNPADRAVGGGLLGAGTGAIIGAIAGGGHGAGIGAAVGGGAIAGAATTPPRPYHRYPRHVAHRSY
jgi:hypothetical protein